MGIDVNTLNWFSENLAVLKPLANWTLNNATLTNNNIEISPGGYIEAVINKGSDILSTSKYLKLGIDTLEYPDDLDRYKPVLSVKIKDVYETDDVDFNKTVTRKLSMNTMNTKETSPINSTYRHFVQIVNTLGKPLKEIHIRIKNDSEKIKTITWWGLFASNDVGVEQYNKLQKESMLRYGTFIEVRTEDPVNPVPGQIWMIANIVQSNQ